jgi:hypothetical protein
MIRIGERHDGEGRLIAGIRHIRGAGAYPGIFALDSARADGVLFYVQSAYKDVLVSNAEVLALVTPKTLVAAPGAGYFLEFVGAWLMLDYATAAFAEASAPDNMAIRYTGASGVIASQTIEATGFIDQAADTYTMAIPKVDPIAAATALVNQPLVLANTTHDYITGGGVLRVRIFYKIHQVLA